MASAEDGIQGFFTNDHHACDEAWAAIEAAAEQGDRAEVELAWQRFDRVMRAHLAMEEDVLFPAFEAATGMTQGPTFVMRMEHGQMRGLLDQMARALGTSRDPAELLDQGDTLNLLVAQHNLKEEGMLYPMCDRALGARWPELREALARKP